MRASVYPNFDHWISSPVFFTSISHFLILFGYKLFSMYYPLFLAAKGFEFVAIGSMYLLLYLSVGVASPMIKKLMCDGCHTKFMALGTAGYALYSAGMILSTASWQFYMWQVFLGASSAIFYTASRALLMGATSANRDRNFAYFYSAPFYAMFLAPVMGGIILWFEGFTGVFLASILIYIVGVLFAIVEGHRVSARHTSLRKKRNHGQESLSLLKIIGSNRAILPLTLAFLILFSVGVYRSFFVLFLKDEFNLSYSDIVMWVSLTSLLSIPLSLKAAKFLDKRGSEENMLLGASLFGVLTLLVAFTYNLLLLFCIYVVENLSKLISQSGKSGYLASLFRRDENMGAMLDTFLTSFGVASGSFVAGVLAHMFGMRMMLFIDSLLMIFIVILFKSLNDSGLRTFLIGSSMINLKKFASK